jgi:hypothetical protein
MRETRERLIERLTKQLAGVHWRCDPADRATVAASVAKVRTLAGERLSDEDAEAIVDGVLTHLASDPCPRRALPETAFAFAHEQLWLARDLEPHLQPLLTAERFAAFTLAPRSVPDARLARFAVGGPIGCGDAVARSVRRAQWPMPAHWIVPDPMVEPVVHHRGEGAWRAAGSASGQMGLVTTADDTLEAMAANARLIVMTAYDCEGAILFGRRR